MSLQLTIPYTTPGNYTYDSDKVEVDGEAKLKDQRGDATCGATYTNNVNLNWGDGSLTGTPVGGASVAGGKLDLKGDSLKYMSYPIPGNADFQQKGCIRLSYTPNYSGVPAGTRVMVDISGGGAANRLAIYHNSNGKLTCQIRDAAIGVLAGGEAPWSPTAGVEYEIEVDFDLDSGNHYVFVDGVEFFSFSGTGTRGSSLTAFHVGSDYAGVFNSDFEIGWLVLFDTPQHSADYTPGTAPTETIYATDNPTVLVNSATRIDSLDSFSETKTVTGSDEVKYTLVVDGQDKYWDGGAWSNSDGTYAQANTAAEIETNKAALSLSGSDVKVKAFLHSADGSTRPALDIVTLTYDFSPPDPTPPNECIVYGWVYDAEGDAIQGATVLVSFDSFFNSMLILDTGKTTTTDADGYWELSLVETATVGKTVDVVISYTSVANQRYRDKRTVTIPNQATVDYAALV